MTAPKDEDREALERLENALMEDILAASDDDILAEARDDGTDPETVAAAVRALFESTVAAKRKARLRAAKAAVAANRAPSVVDLPSDPTEARRLLERVLARHGNLTAAARKGRGGTLSDEEVYGLLEDFRDIGISLSERSGDDK
jgi:hypothetical protein